MRSIVIATVVLLASCAPSVDPDIPRTEVVFGGASVLLEGSNYTLTQPCVSGNEWLYNGAEFALFGYSSSQGENLWEIKGVLGAGRITQFQEGQGFYCFFPFTENIDDVPQTLYVHLAVGGNAGDRVSLSAPWDWTFDMSDPVPESVMKTF